MAGLPKKYAKMGFKKGWREYKKTKARGRTRTARRVSTIPVRRRTRTMARRRTRRRSSRKGMSVEGKMIIGGLGYGMVREPLNSLAKKIPVIGGLGDEIALGMVAYFAGKHLKGTAKTIARSALTIEAHNLGRQMLGGTLSGLLGTQQISAPSNQMSFQ
jgi:hypothetical protein